MPTLQLRRGADAVVATKVLNVGELVLLTTSNTLTIGDGSTAGGKPLKPGVRTSAYLTVSKAGTTFTLTNTYTDVDIYINGVIQIPGYSYTLSGATVTFASELPVGALIYTVGW